MDKINYFQSGGHYIHILFYMEFNLKRTKIKYSIKYKNVMLTPTKFILSIT